MARRIRFGFSLPQHGAAWSEIQEIALAADELGFDSVWVADHMLGIGSEDPLEAWTELTAVAAVTRRVEIGFLVLCNGFRSPALVAKMATTLDHISNGRLVVGFGTGWYAQEHEAYGFEFPKIQTRIEQLEEAVEVVKMMWTQDSATFHGLHYNVEDARCRPRPTRQPHPPILIGGGGEKLLLRLVALYADVWNNLGIYHGHVRRKLQALRSHCKKVERNFEEIEISQQTLGAIGLSRDEARRETERVFGEIGAFEARPELALTGTPDEILRRVRKNVELGITTFFVNFGRRPSLSTIERFAKEVLPAARG